MKTLKEVASKGSEEVVLARDFIGVVQAGSKRGWPDNRLVIVQAVLERTAVVYQPGHVDDKRVVRLDRILVRDEDIRWVPRNPIELRIMRSRRMGQRLGAGFREERKTA